MLMQLATWQEVETYLKTSQGIVIPIGSTEQHGPNGLLGTDFINPEALARGMAEEMSLLVAPTINYGMSQHHLGFVGTISLRPSTLIALIQDVITSLVKHGFTRLYFLNGHGGNSASIAAAFSEFYAQGSFGYVSGRDKVKCKCMNWWLVPGFVELSKELFGEAEGCHATPTEVSLTYAEYPAAVKKVSMFPEIAPEGKIYEAKSFRDQFPDGRIGSNPSLANVDAGEKIRTYVVKQLLKNYQEFLG